MVGWSAGAKGDEIRIEGGLSRMIVCDFDSGVFFYFFAARV